MQKEKALKAAVYARVSSEEQQKAETIENQLDFARRYAELHGIEVVEWYKDDGVSGTLPLEERPEGRRLLRDARRGRFNLVLVYKVDRLARKTIHLLNAYEELERLGIGLRSMTEAFDTGTPAGKFTMTMFASIAALERDTILERTALGKARKARQGRWPGGTPPLGYRLNQEGRLEIEPQEAEIVRTVFRLYVEEGMGTIPIADYLNAHNVPVSTNLKGTRRRAGKWRAGRISMILANPTYRGIYRYSKRLPGGEVEEIETSVPG
ncbi:MAG: recombinase family protein, partial [Clostridia bacterium]|nr:recombinase family protein [Clostridia bacterium]